MDSITVEFQRFGDAPGVLRRSDRYIRTVGTSAPADEVHFGLDQAVLIRGMKTLDYDRFRGPGDVDAIYKVATKFLSDIKPLLEDFLSTASLPKHSSGPYQMEVVTRALELAQLPFEVLATPEIVVTRRIRQPWPPPPVVHSSTPKVLFAWAAPKQRITSQKGMDVPHERHRELLDNLLSDWGGFVGGAAVEIDHVTRAKLAAALSDTNQSFTHVHLLAHGIGPSISALDRMTPIDLSEEPEPSTFLALETEDGIIDRCRPGTLAGMFQPEVPRPASFAIATCHSGEVASIESGGTLAHVLHAVGVPVVLASQLALTQDGSDELITTFLAKVINGDDPREALGACRDALCANAEKTYYDHVALVGYIHIDDGLEQRLPQRKFEVALARLKAASEYAKKRVEKVLPQLGDSQKGLSAELHAEADEIANRFASVRERLMKLEPDPTLSKAQREELHGLQASSLKREAEAAWNLSQVLSGDDAEIWQERSRDALRDAAKAYAKAATRSRDHHWTWVQWLVLEAVVRGSLEGREDDWIISKAASQDAVIRQPTDYASAKERRGLLEQSIWARGSLMELCLLSPMVGRGEALAQAKGHLDELAKACADLEFEYSPITATLNQLERYEKWWGADPKLRLPSKLVNQAKELHSHLQALQGTS